MAFHELIAVVLVALLAALVVALIFRREFRDAVLGGPGEASFFGLLTVKGGAIVLIFGLLIGGILSALNKLPADPHSGPLTMRLNIHFDPDEVNPRHREFNARAFIKTPKGDQPIPIVHQLSEGALSVRFDIPDRETSFYVVFETPKGTWKTDDHNMEEAPARAYLVQK